MSKQIKPHEKISDLLTSISSPARVQILLAIGTGEVCVCHLESLLGLRQAYISQQLMTLRKKKIIIVTARRQVHLLPSCRAESAGYCARRQSNDRHLRRGAHHPGSFQLRMSELQPGKVVFPAIG